MPSGQEGLSCRPHPTPTAGWPLTVPQIGVGEVEGPHKSCEGILCRASLDLTLHRCQLHALHPRPLGPGAPLLHLQGVGSGLRWGGSGLPVLGLSDCLPPTLHATIHLMTFTEDLTFTLGEAEAQRWCDVSRATWLGGSEG